VNSKHVDVQKHMVDRGPLDLSGVDGILVLKLRAEMERLWRG
jgi:hypothetical protein